VKVMDQFLKEFSPDDVIWLQQAARVTLCGSARFEQDFHRVSEELTLNGIVVYSLAVFPSTHAGQKDWYTDAQKDTLDLVHMAKIVHSDAVVVLDRDGYVGESTSREVVFAKAINRQVFYLEGPPNYRQIIDGRDILRRGRTPYDITITGATS